MSVTIDLATLQADLSDPSSSWLALSGRCSDTCTRDHDHDPDHGRAVASDDPVWADLPPGQLEWGGTLSPQAVRRVLCDAGVARIVTAGRSLPIDLGQSTRRWSAAQRRAIDSRDRGCRDAATAGRSPRRRGAAARCRGPTCHRPPAWTQIHHLQWWSNHGPTDLDNGISLCHRCHRLVHDHDWTVRLDHTTGHAHWTAPDGRHIVAERRPT